MPGLWTFNYKDVEPIIHIIEREIRNLRCEGQDYSQFERMRDALVNGNRIEIDD